MKVKAVKVVKKIARGKSYLYVTIPKDFVKELFGKEAEEVSSDTTLIAEIIEYKNRKAVVYYLP